MTAYDPWADLQSRPHICCDAHSVELPIGRGWWLPDILGIVLDRRLSRVERRCALAHELRHVDADDVQVAQIGPDGPRLARRQETRADREAAGRLITIDALVRALRAHPDDAAHVAEELDVTVDVLECRLGDLTAEERDHLANSVREQWHPA